MPRALDETDLAQPLDRAADLRLVDAIGRGDRRQRHVALRLEQQQDAPVQLDDVIGAGKGDIGAVAGIAQEDPEAPLEHAVLGRRCPPGARDGDAGEQRLELRFIAGQAFVAGQVRAGLLGDRPSAGEAVDQLHGRPRVEQREARLAEPRDDVDIGPVEIGQDRQLGKQPAAVAMRQHGRARIETAPAQQVAPAAAVRAGRSARRLAARELPACDLRRHGPAERLDQLFARGKLRGEIGRGSADPIRQRRHVQSCQPLLIEQAHGCRHSGCMRTRRDLPLGGGPSPGRHVLFSPQTCAARYIRLWLVVFAVRVNTCLHAPGGALFRVGAIRRRNSPGAHIRP